MSIDFWHPRSNEPLESQNLAVNGRYEKQYLIFLDIYFQKMY